MDYYLEIKNELIENEITKKAKDYSKNRSDLMHYYNVGKLIVEAQGGENKAKYGNKLIKEYAIKLKYELGNGYSWRNLYNMRAYYLLLNSNEILQPVAAILSWTHYTILFSLKDVNAILYYIDECIKRNLGKRDLQTIIKNNEYERLNIKTRNKLIDKHVKEIHHDKTIGIIICKKDNKLIMEYCSDTRITAREFMLV